MEQTVAADEVLLNPKHWRAWLVLGAVGLVATVIAAAVFGVGPSDVLLLRNDAVAPFTIVDYVLVGYGLVQGSRHLAKKRE